MLRYLAIATWKVPVNQGALIFVTRAGPIDFVSPHEPGVWFTGTRWSTFFQDSEPMLVDSLFDVYVPPMMSDGFETGDVSWWSSTEGFTP